jgi:hypothetical protein
MNIITIAGGLDQAKSILASPLEVCSTHFSVKDQSYVSRLRYVETKPWRLVLTPEPEDMITIDEPNLADLIDLNHLSAAVVKQCFKPIDMQCVIFDETSGLLLSGIAGKGKASYFSRDPKDAMKISLDEALDIIVKMRCSDEERVNMKILSAHQVIKA